MEISRCWIDACKNFGPRNFRAGFLGISPRITHTISLHIFPGFTSARWAKLVHTGLGSSSLVAHVLHPPSPREQLYNRYCNNTDTYTIVTQHRAAAGAQRGRGRIRKEDQGSGHGASGLVLPRRHGVRGGVPQRVADSARWGVPPSGGG